MRAASSAPNPHVNWSSWATTTRLVAVTAAAMELQSQGASVRRSITCTLTSSRAARSAASSDRWTSEPQVITTTSVPSRRMLARANGTWWSGPWYAALL